MIGKAKISTVLILALATFAYGFQATTDWIRFSSPEGRFSVLMPTQPTKTERAGSSSGGVPFTNYMFTAKNNQEIYVAAWSDYPPNMRRDVPGEIKAERDAIVKGMKAKMTSESAISLNGHPGSEFTAEFDDASAFLKGRVYVVGNRLYMLVAVHLKGSEDYRSSERFLTSFELKEADFPPMHKS